MNRVIRLAVIALITIATTNCGLLTQMAERKVKEKVDEKVDEQMKKIDTSLNKKQLDSLMKYMDTLNTIQKNGKR